MFNLIYKTMITNTNFLTTLQEFRFRDEKNSLVGESRPREPTIHRTMPRARREKARAV